MFDPKGVIAFSGTGNADLANGVLRQVNILAGFPEADKLHLSHLDYSLFTDGEFDFYPERSTIPFIKGKVAVIFQSAYKLRLWHEFTDLIWACRYQYGARHVIGVYFFMYGRRQDHGKKRTYKINRNLKYIKNMKDDGLGTLILCDIHNPEETMDNCRQVRLEAYNVVPDREYARYLEPLVADVGLDNFIIYSPDKGSVARAVSLAKILGTKVIVSPKERLESGEVKILQDESFVKEMQKIYPDVEILLCSKNNVRGKYMLIREDERSTGGTAKKNAKYLNSLGAEAVSFCATHPVPVNNWKREFFDGDCFDRIFFGNTIPRPYEHKTGGRVTSVDMAPPIALKLFEVLKNYA